MGGVNVRVSISLHVNAWVVTGVITVFALTAIVVRLRAARRPASAAKILIPPLAMSTGFTMFLYEPMRVNVAYLALALAVGFVFSYPLIKSTTFYIQREQVYVRRSKGFVIVLLSLLLIRLILHNYISDFLSLSQTAGCFFVLAYGMIVPWRIAMYQRFRQTTWTRVILTQNQPE